MQSIDLKTILESTVATGYGNLVTRHTGRAVRNGIEAMLTQLDGQQVAVMDFSEVGCLDISCADEIVGKLLLGHGHARYFLLRGLTEAHCDAINLVLERHGLAVVTEDRDGQLELLGPLRETARRAFGLVAETGRTAAEEVAARLDLSTDATRQVLEELLARRLVRQKDDEYRVIKT